MKLADFVAQTLNEIREGVGQAKLGADRTWIAPMQVEISKGKFADIPLGQIVELDVAVEVDASGGGGISILGMGEIKSDASRRSSNRVKFTVPIFLEALDNGKPGENG